MPLARKARLYHENCNKATNFLTINAILYRSTLGPFVLFQLPTGSLINYEEGLQFRLISRRGLPGR
jgi:hypothetical protein